MVRGSHAGVKQTHAIHVHVLPDDSLARVGHIEGHARYAVVSSRSNNCGVSGGPRAASGHLQNGLHTTVARAAVGREAQFAVKNLIVGSSKGASRRRRGGVSRVDHDVVHLAGRQEDFVLDSHGEVRRCGGDCTHGGCLGGAQSDVRKNVAVFGDQRHGKPVHGWNVHMQAGVHKAQQNIAG